MAGNQDVVFDYDEIARTATTMGTKLTDISTELTDLETTVSNLLQDGLVFEKASPALQSAYDSFSKQMQESAANIKAYAESFNDIATAIAESDTTIANDVAAAQESG
ncbi:WXG100 family type VII secretion target [Streptomyces blattellae]|uniref:WXG100 family type VII secretion target n=1 Tax=Streptomyces blattellae TaxID=2569855 RepID=UPI0012B7941A|nr:WXG100 family type VII secretion target [Streptomyces blattellae]